ncbi:hypothetical protein EOI86_21245 [Hwanghaeella grinnelliae]|uniref:AzlD family protein n=1 Tax=Hwanghaeella grinnelliae TaxID=2500179 RepID=A0A3S2Z5N7_9PROT|nr:AzlD domain-containing protein [Hwanghaeella grinnelliae]RVU33681.1 hypothetical protein EOI86_21245 [Hwanghaeella grinnelliae]
MDNLFSLQGATVITILGMATVTWLCRMTGYALARRIAITGRAKAALEAMPPAILTAIIAPMAFSEGIPEATAAAVTVFAALRLPTLVAVAAGVATVVLMRQIPF